MLKLSLDEAKRWHSYDLVKTTVLPKGVREIINALFERLERNHGGVLVKHSLGYLTAGRILYIKNIIRVMCDIQFSI